MTQALLEMFRCPESIIDFGLKGRVSGESGFFKFGEGVICYGQTSSGSLAATPSTILYDALQDVTIEESVVRLPFDPTQVVNNLRLERYAPALLYQSHNAFFKKFSRDLYYLIRPLLPNPVRRRLQRVALWDWHKRTFPSWPVDRTAEVLLERLLALAMKAKGIEEVPFIWFWPDGFPACAIVTHDVETAKGRNFCSALMDIDDSFGIKSSFQVVPKGRYRVSDEYLESMRGRGFEVNVQDLNHDGWLYRSRQGFSRRVREINRFITGYKAQGFRAGGLYRNTEWYSSLRVSYDMSIPNVAHLDPQRGGCCTVFPYFIGNILELPVTMTQDYPLFYILRDYSVVLWKKQIALILEKHGLANVIIHPDYVIRDRAQQTYSLLLAYLRRLREEGRIWICLPRDVNEWWRTRHNLRLVTAQGKWRIEGEGRERARIAFARRSGDQVIYALEG